jgi:hypothetical protein
MMPTNHVVLVRPASFRSNEQTAVNNYYQKATRLSNAAALKKALHEFDTLVDCLRKHQVRVTVVQDLPTTDTPDALFPNNWVAMLPNNRAALFPMFAKNRRAERNNRIFDALKASGHENLSIKDYTSTEHNFMFLEGTGSMVLDHQNRIAYCALSPRASIEVLHQFCADFGYKPMVFHAYQTIDNERLLVYHTNVVMALGASFAVICLDAVDSLKERVMLHDSLTYSGKDVIAITEDQAAQFAGNMLALTSKRGASLLCMSSRAYASLKPKQIQRLEHYATLVHSPVYTIEDLGGGGVRCMMMEVY